MKGSSFFVIIGGGLALLLVAFADAGNISKQPNVKPVTDSKPPYLTVRDFGAVGDGKADDTEAFQRAVDSGHGDIYIPRGVYRLSRTVVVDLDRIGPTSIVGHGTARIIMIGAGPALKLIGTHDGTANPSSVKENVWQNQRMPVVSGLEIVGAHPQACGIEATKTMQAIFSRLLIRKVKHGIHLRQRNRPESQLGGFFVEVGAEPPRQ